MFEKDVQIFAIKKEKNVISKKIRCRDKIKSINIRISNEIYIKLHVKWYIKIRELKLIIRLKLNKKLKWVEKKKVKEKE